MVTVNIIITKQHMRILQCYNMARRLQKWWETCNIVTGKAAIDQSPLPTTFAEGATNLERKWNCGGNFSHHSHTFKFEVRFSNISEKWYRDQHLTVGEKDIKVSFSVQGHSLESFEMVHHLEYIYCYHHQWKPIVNSKKPEIRHACLLQTEKNKWWWIFARLERMSCSNSAPFTILNC